MKTFLIIVTAYMLFPTNLVGQIGINTTDPKAELDLKARTFGTGFYNGLILPTINFFPQGMLYPTQAQAGMLVYLDSNTDNEGLYSFDGTLYIDSSDSFESIQKASFEPSSSDYQSSTGSMNGNPGNFLKIPFNFLVINKDRDGNSNFTTNTGSTQVGEFVAPETGLYRVDAQLLSNDFDSTKLQVLQLVKTDNDGTSNLSVVAEQRWMHRGNTAGNNDNIATEDTIKRVINTIVALNLGQRLELRFNDNFATFRSDPSRSWFTIKRI